MYALIRFGGSLTTTLISLGHEVMAIDQNQRRIQEYSGLISHIYNADSTDETLTSGEKLWAAFFQGLTPRTAGFNTIDIASMLEASQFFIIFFSIRAISEEKDIKNWIC